ncbi:MAG: enoyl-CoA hydratase/isomerase family protein [Acidobacteria bacterium]|nr:enoyl-CoA hydratase/isomerase family protein [Acidobacteriota bacterium]
MASHYRDIQLVVGNRVARIIFARPPLNVFTIAMMKEVLDAVNQISKMNEVCAIVFAATPGSKAFSAGVSIEEHRAETAYQMLESFHGIFRALQLIAKPVLALVVGGALGGGCELVAYADIVIATPTARFGQPEIKLGLFPPAACVMLPRVIGEKRARELILTGELFSAETARALGLVSHVVAENELENKAEQILNHLRQLSIPALTTAQRAINETRDLPFDEALKHAETIYLNELMSYKDPAEGIEAFIAKRPPNWKHK